MRIAEGEHAQVVTVIKRSHACQRAAVVPVHGNVVGQDEVDHTAAQSDEDGVIAGGMANFAWSVAGLEVDATSAEVPKSFGPNAGPEVANLLRRALRPGIHDSMNGHEKPRLRAGGDGRGRRYADEIPPRHSPPR